MEHFHKARINEQIESADIEELTKRAGSPKTLHLLSKILISALKRESGTASVDLLAPSDLEAMRRTGNTNGALLPRNKKYLILTCTSEFDRVHYPLPLTEEGSASISQVRQQFCAEHLCLYDNTLLQGPPLWHDLFLSSSSYTWVIGTEKNLIGLYPQYIHIRNMIATGLIGKKNGGSSANERLSLAIAFLVATFWWI